MADAVGTTHHVKIGSQFHLVRPGSYRKRPAPLFGARFTSGDPDYNLLNFWQHWAQTCWVGGIGAETWMDDAMYDEGVGVDSTQHEVMVLARDLGPNSPATRSGDGWNVGGGAYGREFFNFNDKLYVLVHGPTASGVGYLYRLNNDDTWSLVKTFTERVRSVCAFRDVVYFGDLGASISWMNAAETFGTTAKPAAVTAYVPYEMKVYRNHMYVAFGRFIYRMKPDGTWDGATAFYEAPGVNYINHMEVHLGQLYMASQNGHILRTDGNNTFDIWQFEGGISMSGLRSFDGRLFVGANEPLQGTSASQGVLYQFTGSAVTELKRWGTIGRECTLGRMRVIGSKLFYGASDLLGIAPGFGIAVYDAVEDAHSIWASNRDGVGYAAGTEAVNYQVDDVFFWKGQLYCSVRGFGIFRTWYTFHDVSRLLATYDTTAAGDVRGSKNGGWYTSSDFDGGTPGLQKLWHSMTIHVDLPTSACSVYVEYSLDGGATYQVAGEVTKTTSATRYSKVLVIGNGTPVRGTRFKYRITLRTTDSTRSPQLRGVIVKYLPQPEPNWTWEMVLVLSERQELLDGSVADVDVTGKLLALEQAFRAGDLVQFTDLDGTVWAPSGPGILIYDLQQDVRYSGPASEGAVEADVRITLMEAVEGYEGA